MIQLCINWGLFFLSLSGLSNLIVDWYNGVFLLSVRSDLQHCIGWSSQVLWLFISLWNQEAFSKGGKEKQKSLPDSQPVPFVVSGSWRSYTGECSEFYFLDHVLHHISNCSFFFILKRFHITFQSDEGGNGWGQNLMHSTVALDQIRSWLHDEQPAVWDLLTSACFACFATDSSFLCWGK